MHWGSQFMNSPGVNAVACDAADPYSLQPELKHAAVQISRLDLPYPLAIVRRCASRAEALNLMQDARPMLAGFPYATLALYGRSSRLLGVRLAGETLAQAWLKQAMAEDELDASLIRLALAPSARAPVSIAPRNIICKCADVSDVQIQKELVRGGSLAVLQDRLKCGTFCGSCVPDLKRRAAEFKSEETAPA